MRLPKPLAVDLLEFLRTGRFDGLRIGQTKDLILHNFPDPDGWGLAGRATSANDAAIWRYGNVELHFDRDELVMIFSDSIDQLDGGPSLAVDRWVLGRTVRPTLTEMLGALCREGIDFGKSTRVHSDRRSDLLLRLSSGVVLRFDLPDEPATTNHGRSVDHGAARLGCFELRERSPR